MDTICTITVVAHSKKAAGIAIKAGFDEIEKLERLLNYFSPESEVSAINRASGIKPVKVSAETMDILKKSFEIAEITDGAFDPTIGSVMRLWGFSSLNHEKTGSLPLDKEIQKSLSLVDYRKIKIDEQASEVFLEDRSMEIDLGGIAKGYAADRAVEAIRSAGAEACLVSIAGDIRASGLKPGGHKWKVGIQNPRAEKRIDKDMDNGVLMSLFLEDSAISTSGDYQRFFLIGDKRYHHIINPHTGYPAPGIMSVSVVADEGFIADAISTAVFVLGVEKGLKLLESKGLRGIIIDSKGEVFFTKDFREKIHIEKDTKGSEAIQYHFHDNSS
jgi:thiamine biosynthesis lipoprotein